MKKIHSESPSVGTIKKIQACMRQGSIPRLGSADPVRSANLPRRICSSSAQHPLQQQQGCDWSPGDSSGWLERKAGSPPKPNPPILIQPWVPSWALSPNYYSRVRNFLWSQSGFPIAHLQIHSAFPSLQSPFPPPILSVLWGSKGFFHGSGPGGYS